MVGSGLGAEHGILIKSAEFLERAGKLDAIVLDKTGTITKGTLMVSKTVNFAGDAKENTGIMTAIEGLTTHPIAKAMAAYGTNELGNGVLPNVTGFKEVPGHGLEAVVDNQMVQLGHSRWMQSLGYMNETIEKAVLAEEERGASVSLLAVGGEIRALWAVEDEVRPEVPETLQDRGIEVWMLTGDNRRTAQYIADKVGIKHVMAEVLPQDKSGKIDELRKAGKVVGMVGDGINDAPALTLADIGFAIGNGTDIAVEAADIVLVRNDLNTLVQSVTLSRKTMTNIRQNLFWALIFNSLGIPLAAIGMLTPIVAGTAMAFSSVTVVTNALRLKRAKLN